MDDVFDNIYEKLTVKTPEKPLFCKYPTKAFVDAPSELLSGIFVNHEKEIEKMLSLLFTVCKNKDTNGKIAIIAPSGMGKTALVEYFMRKTNNHNDEYINVDFALFVPTKFVSKDSLDGRFSFSRNNKGTGLITLDDFHEVFYDYGDKDIKKKSLDLLNEFKNALVITTWTPMGWQKAISENLSFMKLFNEVIYLDGLQPQYMDAMLNLRFSCMLNADCQRPIGEDAIKYAIQKSEKNPRIFLQIIIDAIEHAQKNKHLPATKEDIDTILPALGFGLEEKYVGLPESLKNIINALLSKTTCDSETIEAITGLKRNTISEYLTILEPMNFIEKDDTNKKLLFSLKPIIRFWLEKKKLQEAELQERIK